MRVLALTTDAFGGRGGIAQYNRDYLAAVAGEHEVEVVVRYAPDNSGALPPRLRQGRPRSGRIAYALAAAWRAWRCNPDLIFCGHLHLAPLAAILARCCGCRWVLQTHGIEAWDRPSRWRRCAAERADRILSVSRYTRARVLAWAALDPERVQVLPNTVGERFVPGDRSAARRKFGLAGEFVLLTVARLAAGERYKGHDRVIAALPHLAAAGHDVLYLVAGEGDDKARLQQFAFDTGVSERVRFLGAVAAAELPELYRAADLFAMPSTHEGFGIAFVEALACGTPALGLSVAGAKDIFNGQQNAACENECVALLVGLVAGQGGPSALANACEDGLARFRPPVFRSGALASVAA